LFGTGVSFLLCSLGVRSCRQILEEITLVEEKVPAKELKAQED
jgi:hypothetical protein